MQNQGLRSEIPETSVPLLKIIIPTQQNKNAYLRESQNTDIMSIKNYTGRRTRPTGRIKESITVSDFMTRNLITFKPEQSIMEVMETLLKTGISGGPVVNDKNELIGMISEGDCLKELTDARYHNHPMEEVKVKSHMIKEVDTIEGDMHVLDAANKFLETKHRRFPILSDGKLIGQISQSDVIRAAMELGNQNLGE